MGAYCNREIKAVLPACCTCHHCWNRDFINKKGKPFELPFLEYLEREKSLELSTSTLARLRSTN